MSNLSLKCLMETNKLTGSNFTDWLRCLRLVLRLEKIEYVLDDPISAEYAKFDEAAHRKHVEDATSAQCVMLTSMTTELQRQHEHMFAFDMLKHLKSLYASEAQTIEYKILRDLFKCKLHEGSPVSDHVLKMIGLIERLAPIGTMLPATVSVNLILQSLPALFENFIVNFNMNGTKASLPELHNMLKTYESTTTKGKSVLMVSSSATSSKKKNKQKKRQKKALDASLKPKGGGSHKKSKLPKD
ncbi:uncharacterized protein LOC131018237 [Salvia miltiorrhiza]|uniref:uncharacterized protein LOC131018237 n=1 Tax=Salvia miltiorrhiza TaxID=226208 RepID=UPI0025AD022A|nr:uncharacterized protein LOC131018237 [Salvia miltiorrhiza]